MKTWQEHVELAHHYKAIGQTNIYLHEGDKPWAHVTKIKDGGTWRFNTPVSFGVEASVGGLDFHWYEDIEKPESNATANLTVNTEYLGLIYRQLPSERQAELLEVLEQFRTALQKQLADGRQYVARAEENLSFLEELEQLKASNA